MLRVRDWDGLVQPLRDARQCRGGRDRSIVRLQPARPALKAWWRSVLVLSEYPSPDTRRLYSLTIASAISKASVATALGSRWSVMRTCIAWPAKVTSSAASSCEKSVGDGVGAMVLSTLTKGFWLHTSCSCDSRERTREHPSLEHGQTKDRRGGRGFQPSDCMPGGLGRTWVLSRLHAQATVQPHLPPGWNAALPGAGAAPDLGVPVTSLGCWLRAATLALATAQRHNSVIVTKMA